MDATQAIPGERERAIAAYHNDKNGAVYAGPLWQSGDSSIAPSGVVFYTGNAFPNWRGAFLFATLRGESLWLVRFSEQDPEHIDSMTPGLCRQFGRLRAMAQGPESTSIWRRAIATVASAGFRG